MDQRTCNHLFLHNINYIYNIVTILFYVLRFSAISYQFQTPNLFSIYMYMYIYIYIYIYNLLVYKIANAAIWLATLLAIYSSVDIEHWRVMRQGRVFRKKTMLILRFTSLLLLKQYFRLLAARNYFIEISLS